MIKNVFLALVSLLIFASCNKTNDPIPTPTPTPTPEPISESTVNIPIAEGETDYILLSTLISERDEIEFYISADKAYKAGIWIDLNGNGKKDDGEKVRFLNSLEKYPVGSSNMAIYGKVKEFRCNNKSLTVLDVSKNTLLQKLQCSENQLESLNLKNNTVLESLICNTNKLTALDLSNNIDLKSLMCFNNPIKNLDVSNNKNLKTIQCNNNELTSLDVTNNKDLEILNCFNNKIATLDLSKNTELENLNCYKNELTALSLENKKKLKKLVIYGNNITDIDKMQAIADALPSSPSDPSAELWVVETQTSKENKISQAQVKALYGKHWLVKDSRYKDYAGE